MLVVGIFLWSKSFMIVSIVLLLMFIVVYIYDSVGDFIKYEVAFWLFVFREVMVFGSLLIACLYFDDRDLVSLSNPLEIPFLGCFLLLGSSVTVTGFHHLLWWEHSWILLVFTLVLGILFVCLQLYELHEVVVGILDSSFHASRFCTVGLHFRHVMLGIVGLFTILIVGAVKFGLYRCSVITWYWHFVDYVWLFVYTIVYVC